MKGKFIVERFKASGKWYDERTIELDRETFYGLTRQRLIEILGGSMDNWADFHMLIREGEETEFGFPKLFPLR